MKTNNQTFKYRLFDYTRHSYVSSDEYVLIKGVPVSVDSLRINDTGGVTGISYINAELELSTRQLDSDGVLLFENDVVEYRRRGGIVGNDNLYTGVIKFNSDSGWQCFGIDNNCHCTFQNIIGMRKIGTTHDDRKKNHD